MKKVEFPNFANPHIEEIKQKKFIEVKNNPLFFKFIKDNNIQDAEILDNLSIFLRVMDDQKKCQNCQGNCHKSPSKTQFNISFEEDRRRFDLSLKTCPYYERMEYLKHQFYRMDFPSSFLQYDFNKELLSNDYTKVRGKVLNNLLSSLKLNNSKGLYLYGESGIGKSFILALYSIRFLELNRGTVAFCSSQDLFKDLADLYFQDKESFASEMKALKDIDLLILDGFGNEYKSDFMRDTYLLPLLNERKNKGKRTYFSSNFTLEEIFTMYRLNKASYPKVKQLETLIKAIADEMELKGAPYLL